MTGGSHLGIWVERGTAVDEGVMVSQPGLIVRRELVVLHEQIRERLSSDAEAKDA